MKPGHYVKFTKKFSYEIDSPNPGEMTKFLTEETVYPFWSNFTYSQQNSGFASEAGADYQSLPIVLDTLLRRDHRQRATYSASANYNKTQTVDSLVHPLPMPQTLARYDPMTTRLVFKVMTDYDIYNTSSNTAILKKRVLTNKQRIGSATGAAVTIANIPAVTPSQNLLYSSFQINQLVDQWAQGQNFYPAPFNPYFYYGDFQPGVYDSILCLEYYGELNRRVGTQHWNPVAYYPWVNTGPATGFGAIDYGHLIVDNNNSNSVVNNNGDCYYPQQLSYAGGLATGGGGNTGAVPIWAPDGQAGTPPFGLIQPQGPSLFGTPDIVDPTYSCDYEILKNPYVRKVFHVKNDGTYVIPPGKKIKIRRQHPWYKLKVGQSGLYQEGATLNGSGSRWTAFQPSNSHVDVQPYLSFPATNGLPALPWPNRKVDGYRRHLSYWFLKGGMMFDKFDQESITLQDPMQYGPCQLTVVQTVHIRAKLVTRSNNYSYRAPTEFSSIQLNQNSDASLYADNYPQYLVPETATTYNSGVPSNF